MEAKLKSGTSLIVDRYSSSGVAFSSAKGHNIEWCKAPEVGLLAADLVLYLDIPPESSERGGCGSERYEQLEFQKYVAQCYKLLTDASWKGENVAAVIRRPEGSITMKNSMPEAYTNLVIS